MISIRDYLHGASGPTALTAAFQQAIDAAAAADDGMVSVPPGEYVVCMLQLRSRVTLHLCPGAVLKACPDLDLYPQMPTGHNKDRQPYHLIFAEDCDDIGISGPGIIHGNGPAFWSGLVYPDMPWIKAKERRVSPLIEFRNCRNVVLKDFTILDSPGWTIHPFNCDQVRMDGLTINNHMFGPNTDGIDINGCRYVFISNCRIHGCDDNIIIKATRDARASEYITVTNCILESSCAALGLGAETASGIRHVTLSNCTVINAIRMIQIILWDGGVVEHIAISNITGRALTPIGTDRVIHFDIQNYDNTRKEALPPGQSGILRHVQVSNVSCETRGRILLTARAGAQMEHITLRDVQLVYPEVEDPAVSVPNSRSAQLSNFNPAARVARAAVVADNIADLVLENVSASWPADAAVAMQGLWAQNIRAGRVHCPGLGPSRPELERFTLIDAEIAVE